MRAPRTGRHRPAFSALALLAVMTAASGASAQPGADPGHVKESADARFNEGLKAYDRGDYEGARTAFLQAQAIDPRASQLRNLALTELHTHRPLDALRHLRAYIADAGTPPDARAASERNLASAYAQTGHLSITAPEGSHVKIDGNEVGIAPLKDAVDVAEGPHGVDAVAGGAALHETVNALAGKLTEVAFVPAVVADTRVVGGGVIAVVPGVAPPAAGNVAEPMKPVPYWNGRRTVGVVIAGVGVVGMAVGGAFGAMRGSETSDANADLANIKPSSLKACAPASAANAASCSALTNARSSNNSDAHIEGPMLVGGGVLVAVGLITALWPMSPSIAPSGLSPLAGPRVAGLSWSGSF
jgi:hypothetical protein